MQCNLPARCVQEHWHGAQQQVPHAGEDRQLICEVLLCSYQEFTTRCHQLAPADARGSAKKPSSPNVNYSSELARSRQWTVFHLRRDTLASRASTYRKRWRSYQLLLVVCLGESIHGICPVCDALRAWRSHLTGRTPRLVEEVISKYCPVVHISDATECVVPVEAHDIQVKCDLLCGARQTCNSAQRTLSTHQQADLLKILSMLFL